MSTAPRLTVYMRTYCHLCEDMLAALAPWVTRGAVELQTVAIDEDPALESRYGEWVPVLVGPDGEICHYFLDESALEQYLESAKKPI